jgi:hypothetical protein
MTFLSKYRQAFLAPDTPTPPTPVTNLPLPVSDDANPISPPLIPTAQSSPPPVKPQPQQHTDPRILAIQDEATRLGWTHDQLWRHSPYCHSKCLADVIKMGHTITSVTQQIIELTEVTSTGKREVQNFYNFKAPQPWLKKRSKL